MRWVPRRPGHAVRRAELASRSRVDRATTEPGPSPTSRADGTPARGGHRRAVGPGLADGRRRAGARGRPGRRKPGPTHRADGDQPGRAIAGRHARRRAPRHAAAAGAAATSRSRRSRNACSPASRPRPGLVLHGAALRAELARRADDLAPGPRSCRSRANVLVDAHDAERRRLERDIHDGAQQHLVALVVNLRLAQTLAARAPDRARAVLAEQVAAVDDAIATPGRPVPRDLSRRPSPTHGVAAACASVVGSSIIPVPVIDHGLGRQPTPIEAALYFCAVEAVQNAVKHAAPLPDRRSSSRPTATGSSCSCATTARLRRRSGRPRRRTREHAGPDRRGRGRPHGPHDRGRRHRRRQSSVPVGRPDVRGADTLAWTAAAASAWSSSSSTR